MNTVQTIDLLSLDRIDKVRKLAIEPISIATASATDNHAGFPS